MGIDPPSGNVGEESFNTLVLTPTGAAVYRPQRGLPRPAPWPSSLSGSAGTPTPGVGHRHRVARGPVRGYDSAGQALESYSEGESVSPAALPSVAPPHADPCLEVIAPYVSTPHRGRTSTSSAPCGWHSALHRHSFLYTPHLHPLRTHRARAVCLSSLKRLAVLVLAGAPTLEVSTLGVGVWLGSALAPPHPPPSPCKKV